MDKNKVLKNIEDLSMTLLDINGKQIFICKEIEDQLGYKRLSTMIFQNDYMFENVDYIKLYNEDLRKVKKDILLKNKILYERLKLAGALLVLTEEGMEKLLLRRRINKPDKNYIYITIACNKKIVKIGFTYNVKKRFNDLAKILPVPIKLLYYMVGTFEEEQKIHKELNQYNSHGEWFFFTKEVRKYLYQFKERRILTNNIKINNIIC